MADNKPAFGEWQPESTAPVNAAVLIYVEDWEHYGYGVCRAIKVDMGSGIRWHACAWGIGRDVPMDRVRWWMPLPEPPKEGEGTR